MAVKYNWTAIFTSLLRTNNYYTNNYNLHNHPHLNQAFLLKISLLLPFQKGKEKREDNTNQQQYKRSKCCFPLSSIKDWISGNLFNVHINGHWLLLWRKGSCWIWSWRIRKLCCSGLWFRDCKWTPCLSSSTRVYFHSRRSGRWWWLHLHIWISSFKPCSQPLIN